MGDAEKKLEAQPMENDGEEETNVAGGNPVIYTGTSLADPKLLEVLKSRLSNANNVCAIEIPKYLKRKVKALKKLQLEHVNLETQFFLELHDLEAKYEKLYNPLYEKRREIVCGTVEPTDEECNFTLDDDDDDEEDEQLSEQVQKLNVGENAKDADAEEGKDVKGIPDFWLTALKSAPVIAEMIEEHDEPILKHLIDIKATTEVKPMGFYLEFHFEPNDFFSNTVLTKYYEMKCVPDPTDPFTFDGPEIVKCKGCTIEWKKGMNVTVKTIKKKQKHKARGAVRVVTKTVQNDSFFNFFNPPAAPEDEDQIDDELRTTLTSDFEVGNVIKDRVIPQAVLYFTGENLVDDEFDEEDDEEDEEIEDEDEETEEENEGGRLVKKTAQSKPQPPECKQQ